MKLKIITLTAATLLIVSCGAKKTASSPATPAVTQTEAAPKTTELTPELAEGKSLYENSCARCHKLYEPTKFSKEDWAPILVRMQKKAKLDDVKMASVTNYIHSQL